MSHPRIVSWYSCGDASAVSTKLVLSQYGATHEILIARCGVPEEDADNDRFSRDCEAWFGQPIIILASQKYASCEDVWRRTRFMSGPNGARCTLEMKKAVRWEFEKEHHPDLQAFGFTAEEQKRAKRFRKLNPEIKIVTPLIDAGLTKEDSHAMIRRAGLVRPRIYDLGFENANCIGCVNAQSPRYWNRVRRHFPAVFEARAQLSRELGVRLVKLTSGERPRIFLDQLEPSDDTGDESTAECSLLCHIAEHAIAAARTEERGS